MRRLTACVAVVVAAGLVSYAVIFSRNFGVFKQVLFAETFPQGGDLPRETPSVISVRHDFLVRYFRSQGMNAMEHLGHTRPVDMTEVEQRYMASPTLANISDLPNALFSKIVLVSPLHKSYRVGDKIVLRVDVFNDRGTARTKGGDEVRIWLRKSSLKHSKAAKVTDLGNGSYSGAVRLVWSGATQVRAALVYPREFLRLIISIRHRVLSTCFNIARFGHGKQVSESTPCLSSSPIPGYARTCNLTLANGMVPYFCGHPTKTGLTCANLRDFTNLARRSPRPLSGLDSQLYHIPLPLSGLESQLQQRMSDVTNQVKQIPNNIIMNTLPGPETKALPPCWTRPVKESWQRSTHEGWFKFLVWRPATCSLGTLESHDVQRCLRNTSILLLGDSNARHMLLKILEMLKIKTKIKTGVPFQEPVLNTSITFTPHARPFHAFNAPLNLSQSLRSAIHLMPRHHKYIIIVHYYLHFVFFPHYLYRSRIRTAVKTIKDLLQTYPNAKIVVRGPHVVEWKHAGVELFGDMQAPWFYDTLQEEFRDLQDKVWFMDFWPMTTASENDNIHPPPNTLHQMMRVLFGYICEPPK